MITLAPCTASTHAHERKTPAAVQTISTVKSPRIKSASQTEESGLEKFLTTLVNALRIYV